MALISTMHVHVCMPCQPGRGNLYSIVKYRCTCWYKNEFLLVIRRPWIYDQPGLCIDDHFHLEFTVHMHVYTSTISDLGSSGCRGKILSR